MIFEKGSLKDEKIVSKDDTMKSDLYDVCIVCPTVKDVNVFIGDISRYFSLNFKKMYNQGKNIEYYHTSIYNLKGEILTVNVSWQLEHGPQAASSHLNLIIREFRPRFVAMVGVCAGDRRKVKLGDLIVASCTFSYDDQCMENFNELQDYRSAVDFSYLHPEIKMLIDDFEEWSALVKRLKKIHPMYRAAEKKSHGISNYKRDQSTLLFKGCVQRLRMKLGSHYRKYGLFIGKPEMLNFNSGGSRPKLYKSPMALVDRVRRDNPFDGIQRLVSEAIALDMEAGAFYRTAKNFPGTYALVVKGVGDYADNDKDDVYFKYASSLSAMYVMNFLIRYITYDLKNNK